MYHRLPQKAGTDDPCNFKKCPYPASKTAVLSHSSIRNVAPTRICLIDRSNSMGSMTSHMPAFARKSDQPPTEPNALA